MRKLVAASHNKGKIAEIAAALSAMNIQVLAAGGVCDAPEPEETGTTFLQNAILKAKYYASKTGFPCLADDSGLEVDALNGGPGVYSARYAGENASDAENNAKLLMNLKNVSLENRTARFKCALAFVDVDGTSITAESACEGLILFSERGNNGFGYDPLFLLPQKGKTMAEISLPEKNAISHRGKALKIMADRLKGYWK